MSRGFTLIELVITIALVTILSTIGVLGLVTFRTNQSLRLASQNLVIFARDAQQKSVSREGGLQWGVRFTHIEGGRDSYQLISGPPFNPAGSTVALSSGVEFAPPYPGDLTFDKSGLPSGPSNLIIRLIAAPTTLRTITINAQGIIQEQ